MTEHREVVESFMRMYHAELADDREKWKERWEQLISELDDQDHPAPVIKLRLDE